MTTTGPHFREDLLCGPPLNDLGDPRLGRGGYWGVLFPGPLLGCQESGIYTGKIESRVKGNDLGVVHGFLLWGNCILVQFAPSGKSYPLMRGGEILALEAMKDDFSFAISTAL